MCGTGETFGYIKVDAEIADIAVARIRSYTAFDVGFVYFRDVDDAGHIYGLVGETGQKYREAIRRVDTHVLHITDAIAERAAHGEDWLVVLATDHGQLDEGGHGGASAREREAWVVAWSPNGTIPEWPEEIAPAGLAGMMLQARLKPQ